MHVNCNFLLLTSKGKLFGPQLFWGMAMLSDADAEFLHVVEIRKFLFCYGKHCVVLGSRIKLYSN